MTTKCTGGSQTRPPASLTPVGPTGGATKPVVDRTSAPLLGGALIMMLYHRTGGSQTRPPATLTLAGPTDGATEPVSLEEGFNLYKGRDILPFH